MRTLKAVVLPAAAAWVLPQVAFAQDEEENVAPPGSIVPGWTPDLSKDESRLTFAFLLKL